MKEDSHGILLKQKDAKLYFHSHSWKMKLSQYLKMDVEIFILTYSLPNQNDYCFDILRTDERKAYMTIICHSKFRERAKFINNNFKNVNVFCHPKMHSKVVIVKPDTLYVGSSNFGLSTWHESTICIKSKKAVDAYWENEILPLIEKCRSY